MVGDKQKEFVQPVINYDKLGREVANLLNRTIKKSKTEDKTIKLILKTLINNQYGFSIKNKRVKFDNPDNITTSSSNNSKLYKVYQFLEKREKQSQRERSGFFKPVLKFLKKVFTEKEKTREDMLKSVKGYEIVFENNVRKIAQEKNGKYAPINENMGRLFEIRIANELVENWDNLRKNERMELLRFAGIVDNKKGKWDLSKWALSSIKGNTELKQDFLNSNKASKKDLSKTLAENNKKVVSQLLAKKVLGNLLALGILEVKDGKLTPKEKFNDFAEKNPSIYPNLNLMRLGKISIKGAFDPSFLSLYDEVNAIAAKLNAKKKNKDVVDIYQGLDAGKVALFNVFLKDNADAITKFDEISKGLGKSAEGGKRILMAKMIEQYKNESIQNQFFQNNKPISSQHFEWFMTVCERLVKQNR